MNLHPAERVREYTANGWWTSETIDGLFREQASEMDRKKREAALHKIQQLMHERVMFAPIVEPAVLTGVGPRLAEVPTIPGHPYFSPYEDLKLR